MLVAKSKYNYCLGPVALLQLNLPSPPPTRSKNILQKIQQ